MGHTVVFRFFVFLMRYPHDFFFSISLFAFLALASAGSLVLLVFCVVHLSSRTMREARILLLAVVSLIVGPAAARRYYTGERDFDFFLVPSFVPGFSSLFSSLALFPSSCVALLLNGRRSRTRCMHALDPPPFCEDMITGDSCSADPRCWHGGFGLGTLNRKNAEENRCKTLGAI